MSQGGFWNGVKNVFSGPAQELMKGATDIVDAVVTNQEEAGQIKNELAQLLLDYHTKQEAELTKRHAADMQSDSWLSKNIRPLVLIALFTLLLALVMLDAWLPEFSVPGAYLTVLEAWGGLALAFYFGGRSGEKVMDKIGQYQLKLPKRRRK